MSDKVPMCDCVWPEPHPPHLFAEGEAGSYAVVFACSGTAEEEE